MPELPEVETVKRGLQKHIVGRTIIAVKHDWPKGFPNTTQDVEAFMLGAKIDNVERRAKVLMINLSTDYTALVHLKMTGQMVFVAAESRFGAGHPNDSLISKLPDRSTRVEIEFADGSHLFFNDQRKFGWIRLMPTAEVEELDFFKRVGPEPLSSSFSADVLQARLQRRQNTTIKAALLDQSVLAGIGNIYADEALWGAQIHPATRVKNVNAAAMKLLFDDLQSVLRVAIEKGGSTDKNYVNADGKKGSYIDFARVFRREGLPCPRCGHNIEKSKVAGRGTHTCPQCQPMLKLDNS